MRAEQRHHGLRGGGRRANESAGFASWPERGERHMRPRKIAWTVHGCCSIAARTFAPATIATTSILCSPNVVTRARKARLRKALKRAVAGRWAERCSRRVRHPLRRRSHQSARDDQSRPIARLLRGGDCANASFKPG